MYFNKYQHLVNTCPSASSRTSIVLKEHLAPFSHTFFAYASKLKLQPNINFENCLKLLKRMSVIPLKIHATPPSFADGSFISDYFIKANLFSTFFVSVCTLTKNNSVLIPFLNKTNTQKSFFRVTNKDILSIKKIIRFKQITRIWQYRNASIKRPGCLLNSLNF